RPTPRWRPSWRGAGHAGLRGGRPLEAIRLFLDGVEALAPVDPEAVLPMASMASVYIWSSTPHPDQLGLARRIADLTPLVEGPLSVLKEFSKDVVHLLEGDDTAVFGMPYSRLGHQAALPFELRAIRTYLGFVHGRQRMMLEDANGLVAECRQAGRVGRLPQAILLQAVAQILNGRHRAARAGVSEGLQIAADNDQPYWDNYLIGISAWLAAVAGAEEECRRLMAQASAAETWMTGATWATYAAIMLDLGAARYTSVLERMDERMSGPAGTPSSGGTPTPTTSRRPSGWAPPSGHATRSSASRPGRAPPGSRGRSPYWSAAER
ncbi:hypothetical protein, partial [Microbispora sp. GKU 823]|uniref:hypothetical protein n=1 Tax=Microbispora sp. GKU 823 TaxID=1652100 RepID=UPI0009D3616C